MKTIQVTDELVERAAAAWWNATDADGKRIATVPWDRTQTAWRPDYLNRMRQALMEVLTQVSTDQGAAKPQCSRCFEAYDGHMGPCLHGTDGDEG